MPCCCTMRNRCSDLGWRIRAASLVSPTTSHCNHNTLPLQVGALCGVHCLNTLLQGPYFNEVDLAHVSSSSASVVQPCPFRWCWRLAASISKHNSSTANQTVPGAHPG